MTVPAKVVSLAKTLNKISIVGTVLLIVAILGLISALVYYNVEYKKTNDNVTSLKKQIVDLEKNEQKLILAKDKLSKISSIKKMDSVDSELEKFTKIQSSISTSSGSNFSEVTVDPNKIETSLVFPDTTSLKNALEHLSDEKNGFKKVVLSSLGYNPATGYVLSLILTD